MSPFPARSCGCVTPHIKYSAVALPLDNAAEERSAGQLNDVSGDSSACVEKLVHSAAIKVRNEGYIFCWLLFRFRLTKCMANLLQRKRFYAGNKSRVNTGGGRLKLACHELRNSRANIIVVG